jgi:hypothetical protein
VRVAVRGRGMRVAHAIEVRSVSCDSGRGLSGIQAFQELSVASKEHGYEDQTAAQTTTATPWSGQN